MKKSEKILWTQPHWGGLAMALCLLGIVLDAVYYTHSSWTGIFRDVPTTLYTTAVLLIVVWTGVHYSFSENGFVIRWFGCPIKSMRWADIQSATYMHTWRERRNAPGVIGKGEQHGHAIMISLRYCPSFSPEYDIRTEFSMKHPFLSIFIQFPPKKKDVFLELFSRKVAKLEIQAPDAWEHM